jgi:hypothetical protein
MEVHTLGMPRVSFLQVEHIQTGRVTSGEQESQSWLVVPTCGWEPEDSDRWQRNEKCFCVADSCEASCV